MDPKEIELISQSQKIYDGFNDFILSPDTKVFGKLLARATIFNQVKDVPGDIMEFGVFKGTGLLTFLKLKRYLCPNTIKKVIGFDFFDTQSLLSSLNQQDREAMTTLFKGRGFNHEDSFEKYLSNLILDCGFNDYEFDLIKGDAGKSSAKYISDKPGLKISLLYMDLDLGEPTYKVLTSLWHRVSKGGIVVFDEYGYHKWSESQGVDKFFEDKNIKIKPLGYMAPTAYVVKE